MNRIRLYSTHYGIIKNAVLKYIASVLIIVIVPCAQAVSTEVPEHSADQEQTPDVTALHKLGIKPSLVFANLTTFNASVGSRKRKWGNSGNLFLGADVDLGKKLHWRGSKLHFLHTFFPLLHGTGQPASLNWPGSAGAYHAGAMLHNDLASGYLSRLTISKTILNDRLYLEGGRFNARQVFMVANCETMISCTDPLLDTATGTMPYPYGSWGGYARYQWDKGPSPYVHFGVFESNPASVLAKSTGYDWRTQDAAGVSLLAGTGRKAFYADEAYPRSYEVNLFHSTSRQTDPLTGFSRRGNTGLLLRGRQSIWRADGAVDSNDKPQAMEVFGALSYSSYSAAPFRFNAELGVTWRGVLLKSDDLINLKLGWQRLSKNQQEFERVQRIAAGGANIFSNENSLRLEANTHITITQSSFVELSAQYISRPDSYYNSGIPTKTPGGFVFGLQYVLNIGNSLGW